MNKEEAIKLLNEIEPTDKPAAINPIFTHKRFIEIIKKSFEKKPDDWILPHLFEKRVWQAYKNQKRPKFNK